MKASDPDPLNLRGGDVGGYGSRIYEMVEDLSEALDWSRAKKGIPAAEKQLRDYLMALESLARMRAATAADRRAYHETRDADPDPDARLRTAA